MRIVLDTNVLISGLLNPVGAPGRIVDLLLGGRIPKERVHVKLLYDDRILGEYLEVLERPRQAIETSLAQAVVGYIRLSGERITALPLQPMALPDPDDLPFAEVTLSGGAEALVTGNQKHFAGLKDRDLTVLSPAQFLERFINQEDN